MREKPMSAKKILERTTDEICPSSSVFRSNARAGALLLPKQKDKKMTWILTLMLLLHRIKGNSSPHTSRLLCILKNNT